MSIFKSMLGKIIFKNIKKKLDNLTISEEDITETLKQIRIELLNADVNILVIKNFLQTIRKEAIGYVMEPNEQPYNAILQIVKKELISILGQKQSEIVLHENNLTKIMLVGLQGSGKTTTIAKLANWLKTKKKKKVLIVALDIYRLAAIDQLKQLAQKIDCECFSLPNESVDAITIASLAYAKKNKFDCVLFDTAGRLQTNEQMMQELKRIKKIIVPHEIIYVVDAMSGQDIINVVSEFNLMLKLTGLIITKIDSEARCGAALSITSLIKIPIKFLGNGETIGNLNVFYPDRIANQILGLGDLKTLSEKIDEKIDKNSIKKSFTRMIMGKFDLEDLMVQMQQIKKIGSIGGILKFLPNISDKINDSQIGNIEEKIKKWNVLLSSMTQKERRYPQIIKRQITRKKRIIDGSGSKIDDLNKLLAQWEKAKIKMEEIGKEIKSGKNPFFNLLNK